MRLALAQIDANEASVIQALADARAGDADLVVFPELCLKDRSRTAEEIAALAANGPASVIGFDGHGYNSAAYVDHGAVVHLQRKLYLCDYPPFDEHERFEPGDELRAFDTPSCRAATLICNDMWQPFLPVLAVWDGAQVLLVPSASSTAMPEVDEYWRELTRFYARMLECYVVYVNRVGEDPGFTFWGGSHVVDPLGEVVAEAPRFSETLLFADLDVSVVEERRRELPLLGRPRVGFLRCELERLGTKPIEIGQARW
jgi:predicted amidohydrolase